MNISPQLSTQQRMAMTPQLLQSIRLLQLSALELEAEIQQALETNVMLETAEDAMAEDEPAPAFEEPEAEGTEPVTGEDPAAPSVMAADFEGVDTEGWSGGEPLDEEGEPWTARTAAPEPTDARLHVLEQLRLVVRTEREARLVATLLDAIDDNGYLVQPLDGVALEAGLTPAATEAEAEAALRLIQGCEPAGYGARNLRECLLLQLQLAPNNKTRAQAVAIVRDHLEALAAQELAAIGEALSLSASELRAAVALIRSLQPRPGAQLAAEAEPVRPDVVVSGVPGAWKVMLRDGHLPTLRVNPSYERALTSAQGHQALKQQLQEARWLVRGLQMRNDTLLRTACAVFERQQAFLERGEEGLVALTLREVADAIGMHESTVCRVTSHKWVQTPWGIYAMKAFFPSQLAGATVQTSGTAVKALIRRFIDEERPGRPLSDGDIAALLARRGIHLARRTVAKYREAMDIPPCKQRGQAVAAR